MAKIGLKYPVYAIADDNGSAITYSGGKVLAKAINANVKINSNEVKLPADDAISEIDKSFSDGTIGMEVDDLPSYAKVDMLGYKEGAVVDSSTGEKEISTAGAKAPYVGFGFYAKGVKNNVSYWRAIWLKKVMFGEPNDDFKTKGEKTEFQTPTIEGNIVSVSYDLTDWKDEARLSTEAAAKAWLDGKCGLAAKVAAPVSSVASGTYTTAQSVTLTTTTVGAAIYYTTDGTIPSAANGTLYSTAIACAKPSIKCIKAVATKSGSTNSDIIELYITVTA